MTDTPMPNDGFRPKGQTNILADARIQKLDDTALLFPAGLLEKPGAEDLVFAAVEMMATFANVVIVSLRHVHGVTDSGVEALHTLAERVVQAGGFIYLCDLGAGTRGSLNADGLGAEMTIADSLGDILREEGMDRARIQPALLRFRPQGVLREPTPDEAREIAARLADVGTDIRFRPDAPDAPVGEFSAAPPPVAPESITRLNLHNEPIPPAAPPPPRPRTIRSGTRAFTSILEAEVTPIRSGEVMSDPEGASPRRRRRGKRRRQTFTSVIKNTDIGFRGHEHVPGLLFEDEDDTPDAPPHLPGSVTAPPTDATGDTREEGGTATTTRPSSRRRRRRQTFTSIIDVSVLPTEEDEDAADALAEAVEAVEAVDAVDAVDVEAVDVEAVDAEAVEALPETDAPLIDPSLLTGSETVITPAPKARKMTLDALVDASTSGLTRGPLEPHIGSADTPSATRRPAEPAPYTSIVDVPVSTNTDALDGEKDLSGGRRNRFFTEQFSEAIPPSPTRTEPETAPDTPPPPPDTDTAATTDTAAPTHAKQPQAGTEDSSTDDAPTTTEPDTDTQPVAEAADEDAEETPFIPESRPDTLPAAFAPIARDKVEVPKEKRPNRGKRTSRKLDTSVIGSAEQADLGPAPKAEPARQRGPLKIEINRPHITDRRTIGQIRHDVRIERIGDIALMRPQIEVDRQAWDEMMAAAVSVMSTFANTLILSFESVGTIPESGAALIRTLQERVTRAGGLFYLTDVPESSLPLLRANKLLDCIEENLTLDAYLDAMGLMKEQLRPVKLRSDTVLFMKSLSGSPTDKDGSLTDELGLDTDIGTEEEEEDDTLSAPKERTCPECKKSVPPDALKCPHCKYNLALEKMFRNLSALADAMDDAKFTPPPPKPGILPSGPDASFAGGVRPTPAKTPPPYPEAPTTPPKGAATPPTTPAATDQPATAAGTDDTAKNLHTEAKPETPEERKRREKAEREKRAAIILEQRRKEKEEAARAAGAPGTIEPATPGTTTAPAPASTPKAKGDRGSARKAASPKPSQTKKPKLKAPRKVAPKKPTVRPCPSCGKPIEGDVLVCYHCKYNVNLAGRLMKQSPLATAIKEASLPEGVRADGSTYKTRKEKLKEHVKSGRRRGRILVVALVLVLCIPVVRIIAAVSGSVRVPTLQELRANEPQPAPDAQNPRSWHPYHVGMTLRPEFLLETLQIRPLVFARPITEELDAGAVLAESLSLPVAEVNTNIGWRRAETIRREVNAIGGAYTPQAVLGGFTQRTALIWREASNLRESGSLRGIVLDFGARHEDEITRIREALREEREAEIQFYRRIDAVRKESESLGMHMRLPELIREAGAPRKRRIRVEGVLTFLPVRDDRLQGGAGSYADALRAGADFVRYPGGGGRTEGVEEFPAERWFFVPVLQVTGGATIQFSEERIRYRPELAERLIPQEPVPDVFEVPPSAPTPTTTPGNPPTDG